MEYIIVRLGSCDHLKVVAFDLCGCVASLFWASPRENWEAFPLKENPQQCNRWQ